MRAHAVLKIRLITGAILVLALLLLVRLYMVQVVHGQEYKDQAERQYVHTVSDLYTRGSIYFTTKEGEHVSAATIKSGFLLAIDPTKIKDAEATYSALSQIVPIEHDRFIEVAARTDRTYQEIYPQVEKEEAEKIEAFALSGVQLYRNQWRYYPGGMLGARTIGFVGYQGDTIRGKYGLERYYDDVLMRDNERMSVNFFAELFGNLGSLVFEDNSAKEGNIVTSIEPTVARTLDKVLMDAQEKWSSVATGGVIINPKTGSIYALGAVPAFDLNDRSSVDIQAFSNPLVENVYEMGSIIKPLTMSAGIDAGAVSPNTTYYDAGYAEFDGFRINNYDGRGRGTVSMQEVLNQSRNTGVSFVVRTMGKLKFRDYFLKLKIGSETGIDLPSETYGLVDNLNSPRDIEYATASFGQGIAMTPIATVRALSTLANGGVLATPHIAQVIEYDDGAVHEIGFPEGERVFTEETTETITRMLVNVVDEALRGGTVAMDHYTIAAKTGTAQIASSEGGYYDDRYLHSFFGYFPAYDPEFLVFLYTVEPKGVRYASETLTDPFLEITKFLINYYDIPPDR